MNNITVIRLLSIIYLTTTLFSKTTPSMATADADEDIDNQRSFSQVDEDAAERIEERILSSTVRIVIKTWIIHVEGEGYKSLSSNGHGTVMDGRHLLTHNHFRLPLLDLLADEEDSNLATITIFSADGEQLWQGPLTSAAVAYDDSETLLLALTGRDGLGLFDSLGMEPGKFAVEDADSVPTGSIVAQVNWDEERAFIQWTEVKTTSNKTGTPTVDLDKCLVPGSSGGGVFLDGTHIANNWSRSNGCVEGSNDESRLYSTAALNSAELLASVQ